MEKGENTELLDLKMKTSEVSYPNKRTMFMAPSSHPYFLKETADDGGSGGSGPEKYVGSDVVSSGASNTCARKVPFTASQLQEFQRQFIICKYIMASMPVPPHLLLPLPSPPQSNMDLKFSSGSDPEPWRCKRTDGKKWRCSRDVAPDQKYCERHAHKSKPRSRKPVEIHTNPSPKSNNRHSFQFPTVQPSNDQTRCIEWLGRGDTCGTIPVDDNCNKQLMQSIGFNTRNSPAFQVQHEPKLYPMNFNQYMCNSSSDQALASQLKNEHCNNSIIASLQGRGTTSNAWPKDGISSNGSFTSLTLSMSGWNGGMDDDNKHAQAGIRMLDSERSGDEVLRSQWLNPVSWMSSTAPGGPLGEALCLGNASSLRSPHGYSNSSATSSCSFDSCENGSHGLDFIG
ncbi:growth-regulating factor 8-like [Solanum lycopersicum]|uniref:growth-regulating factor 8-like n=1 Tax=Solanum lycopersicum TaxID=4081 RepID=UPI000276ACED|nr:growth-regulating factor 8-like [Solanum lycopersicum]